MSRSWLRRAKGRFASALSGTLSRWVDDYFEAWREAKEEEDPDFMKKLVESMVFYRDDDNVDFEDIVLHLCSVAFMMHGYGDRDRAVIVVSWLLEMAQESKAREASGNCFRGKWGYNL